MGRVVYSKGHEQILNVVPLILPDPLRLSNFFAVLGVGEESCGRTLVINTFYEESLIRVRSKDTIRKPAFFLADEGMA